MSILNRFPYKGFQALSYLGICPRPHDRRILLWIVDAGSDEPPLIHHHHVAKFLFDRDVICRVYIEIPDEAPA